MSLKRIEPPRRVDGRSIIRRIKSGWVSLVVIRVDERVSRLLRLILVVDDAEFIDAPDRQFPLRIVGIGNDDIMRLKMDGRFLIVAEPRELCLLRLQNLLLDCAPLQDPLDLQV